MGANASTAVKRWVTGDDGADGNPTESPSKRIARDTSYLSRKFNGATMFVYKTKGLVYKKFLYHCNQIQNIKVVCIWLKFEDKLSSIGIDGIFYVLYHL